MLWELLWQVGLAEKKDGKIGAQHYNSQAALFGQSMKEMGKLLNLVGGKPEHLVHGDGRPVCDGIRRKNKNDPNSAWTRLTFEQAMEDLKGVTLESIVIATRTARAVKKLAERGKVDLKEYPLLMHIDAILNQGAEVDIPWDAFTWDDLD